MFPLEGGRGWGGVGGGDKGGGVASLGGIGCGVVVWDMMWPGGVRRGCQVGQKFRQGGKILNIEIPSNSVKIWPGN